MATELPDLPNGHPRARQGFLNIVPADERPFVLRPRLMPDPKSIPPRQWIYGTQLIRGFVTLLVAAGGTGKSSLILVTLISIALKRSLLGAKIHQQCNTALLNLEDPDEEVDRRLAAIGMRYGITSADLDGRFFSGQQDRSVTIASIDDDGFTVVHPDERAIIDRVRDEKIGVIAADPFAESHTLEENSNPQMVQACAAWRRVARFGNCSVLLAHHVRKGHVADIESARGAKALTDSARVGLLLSTMTEDEGETLGVDAEGRLQYVRMDDAKANLAPRAARASWFHLDRVELGNGTEEYPHGDQVAVVEPWTPPSAFGSLTVADCNDVLDRIADGLPDGRRYTTAQQSNDRWAGGLLTELGLTDRQAATVIRTWLRNGVLEKEAYHDPSVRKERIGLRVNDARRPGATFR